MTRILFASLLILAFVPFSFQTGYFLGASPAENTKKMTCEDIYNGAAIKKNECIVSNAKLWADNGKTLLAVQDDGNVVVYQQNENDWSPVWGSKTSGRTDFPPYKLCLQNDGNLITYDRTGRAVWATLTFTMPQCSSVKIQDDGNVVLYQLTTHGVVAPVWTTGTAFKTN